MSILVAHLPNGNYDGLCYRQGSGVFSLSGPGIVIETRLIITVLRVRQLILNEESYHTIANLHLHKGTLIPFRPVLTDNVFLSANGSMSVDLTGKKTFARVEDALFAYEKLTLQGRSVSWNYN